jgi:hypothetical protein
MNSATGEGNMTTPDVVAGNDLTGPGKFASTDVAAGGQFGNCIQFYAFAGDYLFFTNAPGADTGLPVANNGSWTYSLWVNGAGGQADQTTYFAETSTTDNDWRFAMEMESTAGQTNKTRYFIRDGNNTTKANYLGTTNTLDSTWHHLAYTYDATTGKYLVYVDGQPNYTNTFTYTPSSSFDQVGIGALVRVTVSVPFVGLVDDVALWARVLSQGEIQDVMANSIATPVPSFAPVVTVQPTGATNLIVGDSYTLAPAVYGSRPLTYQWLKDGTNLPGATALLLAFSPSTTNDTANYALVVSNSAGVVTSTVAPIVVNDFPAPDLTNGIIAYYPCDSIVAGKAPELVSAYDMPLFGGVASSNIVAGKWGNALTFNRTIPQYGRRVFAPTDSMPGIRRTNMTYSLWVSNAPVSSFQFGEAFSTGDVNTFHGFGGLGGANVGIRMYIRNSSGTVYSDTQLSSPTLWDNTWHNVIYSQHDIGGGVLKAQLYIDGNLVATPATQIALLQPDALGFCINARSTLGSPSGGGIDEVVYWNRVLSPAEIAQLQTSYITNPPSALPPLAINSFTADLAAVVSGDSTRLRWDVPGNITSATISSGVGDVTAMTIAGGGTTNISVTVTANTTYTLTITRGVETVNKSVTIGAVNGVAAGWSLLDNFDFYSPGILTTNGTWNALATPNTMMVVQPAGQNRLSGCYAVDGNGSGGLLNLNGLAFTAGQARTLFFRMTPQGNPAASVMSLIGITERVGAFWYYMTLNNSGPLAYPKWDSGSTTWLLGVSTNDGSSGVYDWYTNGLTSNAVYKVWIDVTNVPIVNLPGARVIPDEEDLFSVYIQKEGDPGRTALFVNVPSDRALNNVDDFTGTHYPDDNINKLYLMSASYSGDVLFDDIYLSKTGINATTPIGPGYAGPAPTLQMQWTGSAWQIVFQGTLQEASSVTGTWTDVITSSPYAVPTTGMMKFYRAVMN